MQRHVRIAGTKLVVTDLYAEGHVLNKQEAEKLNQARAEHLSNNARVKIVEHLSLKTPLEDIQKLLDGYAEKFEFGRRNNGKVLDLTQSAIAKEVQDLARKALIEHFREKPVTFARLSVAEKAEAIAAYLAKYGEKVLAVATRRVEEAKAFAAAGL